MFLSSQLYLIAYVKNQSWNVKKKSLILAILGLDNTSKYWLPVNCGSQLEFQQVAAYLGADRLQKHNLLLSFSFLLL